LHLTEYNDSIIPGEEIIMKKWNADFNRRSMIDRRSGIDRRLSYNPAYFSSGGIERRKQNERRSCLERRADWLKISKFCSVYINSADLIDLAGSTG
jgi:hypothetical protein